MENLRNGPFETEREARAAAHEVVQPEPGWPILRKPQNQLVLERACQLAEVELGMYDRRILTWLSGYEDSVCAVVAGLVARATAAGRPGPHCVTFNLTNDHNAEMYFVLTQAFEDFASREPGRSCLRGEHASRERWADRADAMRTQVEIALGGDQ